MQSDTPLAALESMQIVKSLGFARWQRVRQLRQQSQHSADLLMFPSVSTVGKSEIVLYRLGQCTSESRTMWYHGDPAATLMT